MYQFTKAAMATWLLGAGRKDDVESRKHSSSSRGSKKSMSIRRRSRKDNKSDERYPTSVDSNHSMHLAETCSGIEVSLLYDKKRASPTIPSSPPELSFSGNAVISLHEQLAKVSKIYRAQFNVYKRSEEIILPKSAVTKPPEFRSRNHRIPLFKTEPEKPKMLFDDFMFLLRSHDAIAERACVKDELSQMDDEIAALESDRADVEKLAAAETPAGYQKQDWDIHQQLVAKNNARVSFTQRTRLQEDRGLSLTVHFQSTKAQEALMSKCGCKASVLRTSFNQKGSIDNNNNAVVTLIAPHNCRDGGAAATIQHLTLLKKSTSSSDSTSFFLSRDNGKSYSYGHLPDRIFRRMKDTGVDPLRCTADILYLSTGPLGCYYAEFRSGECWWGSAVNDLEFDTICREWDVYRIVFGPCTMFDDGRGEVHGRQYLASSWIVLARDGRAAWKNIPARLHSKLSSRLASESAPMEVALGQGDSYFVKFLDGTSKYSSGYYAPQHVV